jgi:hypothetical protein
MTVHARLAAVQLGTAATGAGGAQRCDEDHDKRRQIPAHAIGVFPLEDRPRRAPGVSRAFVRGVRFFLHRSLSNRTCGAICDVDEIATVGALPVRFVDGARA